MERKFFTKAEMVELTGLSLSTIARQMRDGSSPFSAYRKVGRRVLFPATIVTELLTVNLPEQYTGKEANNGR